MRIKIEIQNNFIFLLKSEIEKKNFLLKGEIEKKINSTKGPKK